jgi:hypothetical protein
MAPKPGYTRSTNVGELDHDTTAYNIAQAEARMIAGRYSYRSLEPSSSL